MQSALAVGAELLVIGTDVKGVYTKDPKKYSDAIFISEMSPEDLIDMAGTGGPVLGAVFEADAGRGDVQYVQLDARFATWDPCGI
jgi:uridylate kinase